MVPQGIGVGRQPGRKTVNHAALSDVYPNDVLPYCRHADQRPVVIIEQNQESLDQLIELYLGLADIILVPNAYVGLRMINLFKSRDVEILAIEGFLGYGSLRKESKLTRVLNV